MSHDEDIVWLGWILLDRNSAQVALQESNGKSFDLWGKSLIHYRNNQIEVTEIGMALLNKERKHETD